MEFHTRPRNDAGNAEIVLYGVIGDDFDGISDAQFSRELRALGDVQSIDLRLNSPGGDFFAGVAIYNTLVQHRARVNVFIDGLAASAASLIAMAGDHISISANASLMIHRAWTFAIGNAEDLRSTADVLDMVDKSLVLTYRARTGRSEAEITRMLKAETWMQGEEAVKAGFANSVMPAKQANSNFDSRVTSRYQDSAKLEMMKLRLELARHA